MCRLARTLSWLATRLLQEIREPVERTPPEVSMSFDPILSLLQPLFDEPEPMGAALHGAREQAGALEHAQMLRCRGLCDIEGRAQLAGGERTAAGEHREHRAPRPVPEGVERAVERMRMMYRHLAIYY